MDWREASKLEAEALRASLTEQGLDVDALFAARNEIMAQWEVAANSVNEFLVGQEIRIPGYIVPLEMQGVRVVEFLLVPTAGACIHTPPPPANQIIHIFHPEGIELPGLFDPVWVSGVLEETQSTQDVSYSDGQTAVALSYGMRRAEVEPY